MEYRDKIQVSEHTLWLIPDPAPYDLIWPPTGVDGFVYFGKGGVLIKTGVSYGLVDLTIIVLDSEPALDAAAWEDIDEGSLETADGQIYVATGVSFENIFPGRGTYLVPEGWSNHRVRVSATGRASNPDERGDDEKYLIQMWPEDEPSVGIVHQLRSERILAEKRAAITG